MQLERQLDIPERSSSITWDTLGWSRLSRQVFWLADGRRDVTKIAILLHKDAQLVKEAAYKLQQSGYMRLRRERKTLVMNPALLKESFDMVAPQKDAFARSFYERLFTDYPQTKPLFAQTDMRRQESSLMATLAVVVAGVERGENLVPTLQQLGQKHKRYGATADGYPLVGAALLETFHEYLGSRFTAEMQSAWEEAYEIISVQMLEGAKTI